MSGPKAGGIGPLSKDRPEWKAAYENTPTERLSLYFYKKLRKLQKAL